MFYNLEIFFFYIIFPFIISFNYSNILISRLLKSRINGIALYHDFD